MFALKPKATFKADVSIPTPFGEGKVKVEFRHKGRKAFKEYIDTFTAEGDAEGRSDADALFEIVENWSGIDSPYNRENLETLLDAYPTAAKQMFAAYNSALFEGKVDKEAAKN